MVFRRAILPMISEVMAIQLPIFPGGVDYIVAEKRRENTFLTCSKLYRDLPDYFLRAVPERKYEFLLGRLTAGILLAERGVPMRDCFVDVSGRRPVWPVGVTGSISHSSDLLIAAVCAKGSGIISLGVDIEILKQSAEVENAVKACFTPIERLLLSQLSNGVLIGFSMKESLFKCLNPVVGVFFDFLDAEIVNIEPVKQWMDLVLHRDLGGIFRSGATFRGAYQLCCNHVWTSVCLHEEG